MKHKFTWTSKYSGTCGDHYCDGHYRETVKCTCGWTKEFTYRPHDEEKLMLQHRLDYLESRA